ncbi:cache domain-containing sensor histidine kinase [Eubacterium oxidoreducens]|uniref:histidine kinase n=1 Tax=Eubacterium oxidoreducens TaxID=1732 RepID=A0A1G6B588_EUBOX|nr:sensor histidine kinase [Eubacterium oxidoreducens]SDB15805.1 two-component system, sensor histidine kinase YesM [Eubacterium oxidoreducens]
MKKIKIQSTFQKLTLAFLLCGMLPLLVCVFFFFVREYKVVRDVMVSNYSQITNYFTRNVEDILESVDSVMEVMYDYDDGEQTLAEVLQDEDMQQSEKALYMQKMFRTLIAQSEYISSERFADNAGNVYSYYFDPNKTLRKGADFYTSYAGDKYDEAMADTSLTIYAATQESKFCINSDDFVFVIRRNFMNISNVKSIQEKPLGTMYMDINVENIGEVVDNMQLDHAQVYLYLKEEQRYLYSENDEDYIDGADPLGDYVDNMKDSSGYFISKDHMLVIYEKIEDTDIYSVVVADEEIAYSNIGHSKLMLVLILCFVVFTLLILYMNFSRWISSPVVELKRVMEKVQTGDLSVRAKSESKDEMAYIIDGFNKMVEDLDAYIKEVYMAKICRQNAELNALKMQIQPHYLYNTLDVIRMTALDQEDRKTAKLLESLAKQLRYVLGEQAERVPILDEINMLKEYAVIMQVRFRESFDFHVSLSDEDARLMTLKMLFQPIVENAIKHGIRPKNKKGRVAVEVSRQESFLMVTVMDDGVGMSEELVTHIMDSLQNQPIGYRDQDGILSIGMKNVYDRIRLSCGEEYGFVVESIEGMGTIVTFRLPIWEEADEESNHGR